MYSELLKLFDIREVANLVHDTLGSLPTVVHVDETLQAVKLQRIGKTVESQLYSNPGGRALPRVLLEGPSSPPVALGRQKQSE